MIKTRRLNNNDLDIYIYIKDYIKENGIAPSHREILKNVNIKSLASVKYSIEKLEELKFVKLKRTQNDVLIPRGIKITENKDVVKLIKELREKGE